MPSEPSRHHRRSIRLRDYDYSQAGVYFVTICVEERECLFGEIVGGEMRLNHYSTIVQACWDDLPNHYRHVELDAFVIMPNHIHGIIVLTDHERGFVGAGLRPAPTKHHPLSEIVRAFKSFSARRINELRDTQGTSLWQRNYYEHIIRNEYDLEHIRKYISENPLNWAKDENNPQFIP